MFQIKHMKEPPTGSEMILKHRCTERPLTYHLHHFLRKSMESRWNDILIIFEQVSQFTSDQPLTSAESGISFKSLLENSLINRFCAQRGENNAIYIWSSAPPKKKKKKPSKFKKL